MLMLVQGKKEYPSHLSGNRLRRPLGTSLSTDLPSTRPPMRNVQSEKLTPGNPRRLLAKEASAQIIPNPRKHHQEASPHKLYRLSSVPLVHPSLSGKLVIPGGSDGRETKEYSVKLMPQSDTDKHQIATQVISMGSYLQGRDVPGLRCRSSNFERQTDGSPFTQDNKHRKYPKVSNDPLITIVVLFPMWIQIRGVLPI